MSDFIRLLRQSRLGDMCALDRLLAIWRPFMRRYAHGKLGSPMVARVDTSDVVQNALMQVTQDIAIFRGNSEAEWSVWLRTILAGQAANIRRFHHSDKRSVDREEASFQDAWTSNADAEPTTEEVELEAVRMAIESLSTSMKEVLRRRVFQRQPYEVIAKDLEITTGNARVLLTRATRKLKELLEKDPQQKDSLLKD